MAREMEGGLAWWSSFGWRFFVAPFATLGRISVGARGKSRSLALLGMTWIWEGCQDAGSLRDGLGM